MFTENQMAHSRGKRVYYPLSRITVQQRVYHPANDIKSKKQRLLSIKRRKVNKKHVCYPSNETKSNKNMLTENQTASSHGKHVYYLQRAQSQNKHVYCVSNYINSNDKCLLRIKYHPVIYAFTINQMT
jgi:hypothetical protein